MNPHESNEENSWSDTLNLLSDGLKGRLKNTASEKPCRQPPIGETDSPAPFPPNALIFRPISQQQSAYPAKLPNVQQKHHTAAFRTNPKHCGRCGRFPCQSRNVAKPVFKPKHHSSPRPAKPDWPTFQTAPPL
ncbi:hypothetical protein NEIELOOT_01492 [Neisseria elongata subsp. glycolytica ATCC 29315]|uniref:Uncharacterized protein n=1 Tax=Neisseria elongata subsp. glycolytica ATCC 29315 TaxID=546263 RepID=D4DQZ9_NEIEG|nr:hypothetical protein NEIELOOT_01492 [Neisseria elongata subsp. glycolytica ATCC 29315]